MNRILLLPVLLLGAAVQGCGSGEAPEHPVPSAAEVASYFEYEGALEVELRGNVAQLSVEIDVERFRAGGTTWLRASPYIFLFSAATRDALEAHPGLGGIRVIVQDPEGAMVAQALLEQGRLNSMAWQHALSVAGLARQEGTERPGRMRDLIRWGEDRTDFEYNPAFVPRP